jgi:hypothetical protein
MVKACLFVVITLSFLMAPSPSFGQGMIGSSRDITPDLRQLNKNLTKVNSSINRFNKDVLPEIKEMNKNLIQVSDHMRISTFALIPIGISHSTSAPALCDAQFAQILRTIQDASAPPLLEQGYWFAQIVLTLFALIAAFIAWRQLKELKKNRESSNVVAILERTAEHNWKLAEDPERLRVVELFADLNVPNDPQERKLYWATRLTHISHVLLAQQVWILAGRPKEKLTGSYENWQRFAVGIAKDIRGITEAARPKPYQMACKDYWKALHDFEETDPEFVKWLERISNSMSGE